MTRRNVILAGVAGAVLLLAAWYFLLWSPRGNALDEARERRETAERERIALSAQLARLRAAQREEPEKRARLDVLRQAIPDQPDLAQFLLDANDAANRSGIDFLSIAPSPPAAPTGPGPSAISFSMSIEGGYFQVLDFLNRLEDLPRVVVIDTLNVSAAADRAARLSTQLSGRLFTRTAPAGGGATTTTTTSTTAAGGGGATTTTSTTAGQP